MDCFLGTIKIFPYCFEPMGWELCDGTILQVYQNTALYSLIGNLYGGNASQYTFALPDLRGATSDPNLRYYIAVAGLYPTRD